ALFARATEELGRRGLLLADTKFEFGVLDGRVLLIDEALTPDSSRLWPAESWRPGASPPSYDKQILRDWLLAQPWDRRPPPPPLDPGVVAELRARYLELCEKLTGGPPPGL
ncbi:MAG TPA: phosphoribosylaminoimidazolesuccinocarboxamide synthase, partial [Planctomycetota bacterium]|nr:phosphoribosylaminoimidazolesuccinocarboxamide synthase [Planctomycetota bacterium]